MDNNEDVQQDELELLKQRATTLGIAYHPSIGLEKLRIKINNELNDDPEVPDEVSVVKNKNVVKIPVETKQQRNARLHRESSRLIRVNITCMNPNKKEWSGEVFTISNSAVGTFKKFVQFDTEEGYHVPEIILKHIKERKCQVFVNKKLANGNTIKVGKLIKEFSVAILEPLTQEEMKDLAIKQAMAQGQG